MDMDFIAALDVGQSQDYSAIIVLQQMLGEQWPSYALRFLQRFPIRTSYPDIVDGVQMIVETPQLRDRVTLLVDKTGVGAPVVDLLKKAHLPVVRLCPVTITGGNVATRDGNEYHVPKRDLATAVKVLLDGKRLKISTGLPQYALLVQELEAFRVKISLKTAHDSYEAWREGDHDDLVLSVAIACWWAEQGRKKMFAHHTGKPARPAQEGVYQEVDLPRPEPAKPAPWTWGDIIRANR